MNLLHVNDRAGEYPPSYYAATRAEFAPCPALQGEVRADVCIVGAGYTGLSAALHLAEKGLSVVVLEAHRVGFGASGRNGGQLGSGQRLDQMALEQMLGEQTARRLWHLGEEAKGLVRGLIDAHGIDCALKPGVAWAGFKPAETDWMARYGAHMQAQYGYSAIEPLDRAAMQALCPSPAYHGGLLDHGAAHLHPLNFALGLARAAAAAGVRIYERSEVHHIKHGARVRVATDAGHLEADHLILAGNGYLGGLERAVAARVMPINNFIVATEPLGERAAEVLRADVALCDTKFVVNYFRLSEDNRLLFGGGESYGYRFPKDIRAVVSKPMLEIFPSLKDVRLDYAWGGTLAITTNRMPCFSRPAPNILSASGYSGHGVAMAVMAGKVLAATVAGQSGQFDLLANLPQRSFPGGAALRWPLLVLAMTWYGLRDRLGL